ncbi:MAG: hypothetical protein C6P37_07520 [Caldibacillus debilis]|uniref:Uncharacterized protein n=1 Tax=Caldibacillus debilis TaxID=301148 RepID=A0A3E0K6E7_9BACI|nr:MAG: hypothetical protein BAA03_06895 [Caldibacillus debilis]REJ26295.1 MAG: hypothetical protein C6W56_12405 [Caldibacillus debilis]REJ29072.1 MAG: hypothetical protein C6P37_07520 [Caldibacillus debilis]
MPAIFYCGGPSFQLGKPYDYVNVPDIYYWAVLPRTIPEHPFRPSPVSRNRNPEKPGKLSGPNQRKKSCINPGFFTKNKGFMYRIGVFCSKWMLR